MDERPRDALTRLTTPRPLPFLRARDTHYVPLPVSATSSWVRYPPPRCQSPRCQSPRCQSPLPVPSSRCQFPGALTPPCSSLQFVAVRGCVPHQVGRGVFRIRSAGPPLGVGFSLLLRTGIACWVSRRLPIPGL